MDLFDESYYLQQKLVQLRSIGEKDFAGNDYTLETLYQALNTVGLTARQHYDAFGYIEGLNPSKIFDNNDYLREKLAQIRHTDPDTRISDLVQSLHSAGLSPLQHFEIYGNSEWLSPTAYFNVDDYLMFKANSTYADGTLVEKIQRLTDALNANGLTPWEHFIEFGAYEGINPSKEFYIDAYLSDKLEQLQQSNPEYTMDKLNQTLKSNGLNALTHYLEFGSYEGLRPSGEYTCNIFDIGTFDKGYILGIDNITLDDFQDTYLIQGGLGACVEGVIGSNIIDAEKSLGVFPLKQDELKCWAAAAANMLTWTGWGVMPHSQFMDVEDVIFKEFVDNFQYGDSRGGSTDAGITWFFNGEYPRGETSDQPKQGTGNYLGISAEPYLKVLNSGYTGVTFSQIKQATESLQQGASVEVSVRYNYLGGHALTCWGYTVDERYSIDDPNYYSGLIVSDSDNSRFFEDGASNTDSLQYIDITWNGETYVNIEDYFDDSADINYHFTTTVTNFMVLMPNPDYFMELS